MGLKTSAPPVRSVALVPKPPYDSDAWRDWLNAVHVARDKGDTLPPAPNSLN